MDKPQTTATSGRGMKIILIVAIAAILAGGTGYKSLGYEYAEGYAAGWKYGESNQRDIFFNEMDRAVSLGTHQQMTIWNGDGNKKMKYMFYKVPDSY